MALNLDGKNLAEPYKVKVLVGPLISSSDQSGVAQNADVGAD